jgi:hypothetical protein
VFATFLGCEYRTREWHVCCQSAYFRKLLFVFEEQHMTYLWLRNSTWRIAVHIDNNWDLLSGSEISLIKSQRYFIGRYCHYKRNCNGCFTWYIFELLGFVVYEYKWFMFVMLDQHKCNLLWQPTPWGHKAVRFILFLTLALDTGEIRTTQPGHWTGEWIDPRIGVNIIEEKHLFPLLRFEPRMSQSIA